MILRAFLLSIIETLFFLSHTVTHTKMSWTRLSLCEGLPNPAPGFKETAFLGQLFAISSLKRSFSRKIFSTIFNKFWTLRTLRHEVKYNQLTRMT